MSKWEGGGYKMNCDTEETKNKVNEVMDRITEEEIETVKGMETFGRSQFLTEKFGDEDEKFGISFALFPLWVQRVEERIL